MTDFEAVYSLYFRTVYRYALSLCRKEAIAEEITQETFYKALSKANSFDGRCKVSVWLCQIAKNTWFSMCRKGKYVATDADISQLTDGGSLEERFCRKQTVLAIQKALESLEEPYKEVFAARVYGELSYQQIGNIFGKTEVWARVTYHRAKLKIKEALK